MNENVGNLDRLVRSIAGPALIIAGYTKLGGNQGRPLGLLSIVAGTALIETAISKVCPVNRALGIDTRSVNRRLAGNRIEESSGEEEAALVLQELPSGAIVEEVLIEAGPDQSTWNKH